MNLSSTNLNPKPYETLISTLYTLDHPPYDIIQTLVLLLRIGLGRAFGPWLERVDVARVACYRADPPRFSRVKTTSSYRSRGALEGGRELTLEGISPQAHQTQDGVRVATCVQQGGLL